MRPNSYTGKRILFLINSLGSGGAEKVFIQQLNALHEQGVDVSLATLYSLSPTKNNLEHCLRLPKEKRYSFTFRGIFDRHSFKKLKEIIAQEKFDLVYSTLNDANALARALTFTFPKKAFVIREANTVSKKPLRFRWWDYLTNTRVSTVLAVSEEVRQSILKNDSRVHTNVVVLKNGVELPPEREQPENAVLSLVTVGRCVEQKNQALLIDALQLIRRQGSCPPFLFHVVGDGVCRSELERQVQELGLGTSVQFHGQLPPEKVAEVYRSADIFLLSSRWEGCPNVLLEAMSWGIPCIATAVGGVPDLVTPEVDGILVPTEDVRAFAQALTRLMDDVTLRERLGWAARTRIERDFSFATHLKRLQTLFQDLLSSSSL